MVTDQHVQIRSFLRREYPETLHHFNVWHFGNSVQKLYLKLRKMRLSKSELIDYGNY